jgi:hypothetical protein
MNNTTAEKQTKHTPGPWRVICDGQTPLRYQDGTLLKVSGDDAEYNFASCQANARLIAAAPDLLSACQIACCRLEGGTLAEIKFNHSVASRLRAAIAKALQP